MTIHHLDCATMCPRGGRALLGSDHLVSHCLLIEGPEGLVLVDTGFGTRDVADPSRLGPGMNLMSRPLLSPDRTALHQIRALGHDPADVRDILVTHLDADHAGGLGDFPEARVHILAEELAAARAPRTANERSRYRSVQWGHGPKWVEYGAAGESWYGFSAARVLDAPDVLLVPLPGHTRGHSAVAVRDGDSWLLHCGDAYLHHAVLDGARPPLGAALFERALAVDNAARLHNHARLRALRQEHEREIKLFCAHDPRELAAFR